MIKDILNEYDVGWRDGPFGNADASRENLKSFIEVPGVLDAPDHNPKAMSHRIIVGRKGSGKTFYMRMLKDEAIRRGIVTSGTTETLDTSSVLKFQEEVEEFTLSNRKKFLGAVDAKLLYIETWSLCWDRAITIGLISLLRFGDHPSLLNLRNSQRFRSISNELDEFRHLFPKGGRPSSFSASMAHVVSQMNRSQNGSDYFSDPSWEQVKQILQELIKNAPPLTVVIDAIDEDFETAPQAWLTCQAGLFRSIFRTLNYFGEGVSNRVHIVVSLRDIVYAGVMKTEHATRFVDSQYIKFIDWTPGTIRSFLFEKIRRVQLANGGKDGINEWAGLTEISNSSRRTVERLDDYIIRHTRMVPRDIVLMGNAISSVKDSHGKIEERDLKSAVSDIARILARESMRICVIEALASSSSYVAEILATSGDDFEQSMYDVFFEKFIDLFELVSKETLLRREFEDAIVAVGLGYESDYRADADPFYRFENIMWRRGLLACKSDTLGSEDWEFNWTRKSESDLIPNSAKYVGFHSCLIDLYKLKVTSGRPVF